MSLSREMRMPEESKRLVEIYKSNPEMLMGEVIEKYASDEYKAMLAEEDEWEEL